MICPDCGKEVTRDEVDIGIGMMYGPAHCDNCGWDQERPEEQGGGSPVEKAV